MPSPALQATRALLPLLLAVAGFFHGHAVAVAEEKSLIHLDGKPADPFARSPAKLLAFVFARTDCPVSNVYAPEIQRLHQEFAPQGVEFWLVYPDRDETPEMIKRHLAEFKYPCAALRDPGLGFTKRARVNMTPEVALFRPSGELLYHGRIDDRYADFGKVRPAPTCRDLSIALAAALAGKPVPRATGPATGCFIERLHP